MRLFAVLGTELVVVHRVVVFVKPHHHRTLVRRIVRHKQIGGVGHENPAGVEKAIFLEGRLHRSVEPLLPALPGDILDRFAQGVVVAGHLAGVVVLVVKAAALDPNLLGLRVQVLAGEVRRQGAEQAPTLHHPLEGRIGVLQMQLQTEVGGQLKPERHFLFLTVGGHGLRQAREDLFPKTQFKELLFVGLADDLDLIELAPAKGLQDLLLMVFDDLQVHGGCWGQGTKRSWASWSARSKVCSWRLASRARARWERRHSAVSWRRRARSWAGTIKVRVAPSWLRVMTQAVWS